MKGFNRTIGLTMLLICFLSAKTYASTNKTQTYVSKCGYSALLFAQQTNDSAKVADFESRKLKNPWLAFGIALVPGAIIHGAGHFYAGRIGTGFVLLGSELIGTGLIGVGLISGIETITGEPREGWVIELEVGLILFVGSWIYDIIGSPIVVVRTNKDLLARKHGGLKIQIKEGNLKLVTIWSF
jgi:TM2 domain-containing membrane protein YozV